MNNKKLLVASLLAFLVLPVLAFGATVRTGEEVDIRQGETITDNLYAAGGNVSIDTSIFGDLLVAGGKVVISENVSEDLTVAGGDVTVLGDVAGDLRIAGGDVTVSGKVGGDVVMAGGVLQILSGSTVGKDVLMYGGDLSLKGTVNGDVEMHGGLADIDAIVEGNVLANAAEKITLGAGTVIKGNLLYKGLDEDVLETEEGFQVLGTTTFEESNVASRNIDGFKIAGVLIGTFILFKILLLLVTALVFVFLFRNISQRMVDNALTGTWKKLGLGFVGLVVTPVAIVLLFLSMLGGILAVFTILSYIALLMLSCVFSGILFGAWAHKKLSKQDSAVVNLKNTAFGVIVLSLIALIPVVGSLISLFLVLVMFGTILTIVYRKIWVRG